MDHAAWERAKDLIADALERPAAERDAFVSARCSDPAVLAEVRALISDYAAAPDFLEQPPRLFDPGDLDDPDEPDDDLEPGTQIGPYVVVDRLGRGGMGQVFLGRDTRLKRKVALKRLLPSRLGPSDERSRIVREARAAARINHPNVATIHDILEHETRVFIVMEYVEGESLAARLRRDRLSIGQLVGIGGQLAAALAAAHARGVVHRDLKPANIQLTPEGTVKVLDFGIAKAIAGVSTEIATTTGSGVFELRGGQPGTPAYMSPEQLLGRGVDERSDIFSLGIVLFEMATGRRPFADDAVARLAAVGQPAERADAIVPAIPRALADIVAKALEGDIRQRFQSAAELGAALDRVRSEVKTAAAPAGGRATASGSRWRLARRIAATIVITPIVLGLLGAISTAAFNVTLQRPGPFDSEPFLDYVRWGYKSNVAQLVFALGAAMLAAALSFVARLLTIINPLNRALVRARQTRSRIASTLGLNDPIVLAEGLALIGTVAVAAVIWKYRLLITAFMQRISAAAPEQLLPLAPENVAERATYGIIVNILMVTFVAGFFRIIQLRARHTSRNGSGAVAIAGAMLAIIVLMQQIPYRIVWHNKFERIEVAAAQCYVIGEHEMDWLVYCPDTSIPRNRVIRRDDPAIRRTGIVESIFTPANPSAPAAPPTSTSR
jgi:hypothetical protein